MENEEKGYREFTSGASRDTGLGKLELSRYTHPAVFKRYGEYMRTKQIMSNGDHRRGDNWQEGFPGDVSLESLMRHVTDIWLHLKGWGEEAEEDLQSACCASLFNVSAILLAALRRDRNGRNTAIPRQHDSESPKAPGGARVELDRDLEKDKCVEVDGESLVRDGELDAIYPGGPYGRRSDGHQDDRDRAPGGSGPAGEVDII